MMRPLSEIAATDVYKRQVKNDYTGLTYFCGRWFYVEKSALNWTYTGLTNYRATF